MHIEEIGFIHQLEIVGPDGEVLDDTGKVANIVPLEGLTFLIGSPFGDSPPINIFYCGLFTKNFVPTPFIKSENLQRDMGEFVQTLEATRPTWDRVYDGSGMYDNFDSPAVFTPTQDASVYGSFIISAADKGGSTGLMISVARFPEVKRLTIGNAARLKTSLTYTSKEII